MRSAIAYIREELQNLYPREEIESFILLIFLHLKSYDRTQFIMALNEKITASELNSVKEIVEGLKKQEPIQYIIGETEFYGLPFRCKPGALIPRPETEELVDWVLKESNQEDLKILDIGTGTGCIPISLKKNLQSARVYACDISEICLNLAKENSALNKLDIDVFKLDILADHSNEELPLFDVIVSNPPYVTESEKQVMEDNVLEYEPATALFVPDSDPLLFYKAIVNFAKHFLAPQGRIYWEINEAFGQECISLLEENGYTDVILKKDINGKARMISAIKQ